VAIDITSLNASNITTGILPAALLGSGTVSTSTYLRGDGSWVVPSFTVPGSTGQVLYNAAGVMAASSNLSFNSTNNWLTATNFAGAGAGLTSLNATYLAAGTVPVARLGSGTASTSTFLRGDSSWQVPPATPPAGANTNVQFNNNGVFGGTGGLIYNPTASPPLVQATGALNLVPVAGYPSFRYRDNGTSIKGGFTPYGTAFGTVAGPRACGRLTYDANNPAPLADFYSPNAGTIYYLPVNGAFITLWNSNYNDYEEIKMPDAGISASLAGLPNNLTYDAFVQNNLDGTARLILGTAWTTDNTRANLLMGPTAGMLFQGGNQNARYVGTLRLWGADGQGSDQANARLLWNAYNQVPRKVARQYTAAGSWTLTVPTSGTTVERAVNGDDANARFYFLLGGSGGNIGTAGGQFLEVDSSITVNHTTNGCAVYHGVGLDQGTASSFNNDFGAHLNTPQFDLMWAKYSPSANLGIGLHWITLMEGMFNNSGASASLGVYNSGAWIYGYFMA
jgi:hypothetical protein